MNPTVIENFITPEEQEVLVAWARAFPLKVRNQPDHLLARPQNEGRQPTSGKRLSGFIGYR